VKVRVTRRAQAHIDRAALWWDQNRPLAPKALDEALTEAFSLLGAEPGIGARALNVRTEGVRRVHLARVHYYLYYRVRNNQVEVLAFWHTSRGAGPFL
jgi:plasmid stabilization system protein ParE